MNNGRFRTLVRIVEIDKEEKAVWVILPGWHPYITIRLDIDILLDANDLEDLYIGQRFHAEVNMNACVAEDLEFTNWENS